MPLNTSYLKSEMMHAEIRLANPESYMRLLHAFEAIHNSFSHDSDLISFFNDDDGMSLRLNANINHVSFGPIAADENDRRWTENIPIGAILSLLLQFMRRDYAGLEAYPWMSDEFGDELSNGTSDEN
jgi:hypothetical protein